MEFVFQNIQHPSSILPSTSHGLDIEATFQNCHKIRQRLPIFLVQQKFLIVAGNQTKPSEEDRGHYQGEFSRGHLLFQLQHYSIFMSRANLKIFELEMFSMVVPCTVQDQGRLIRFWCVVSFYTWTVIENRWIFFCIFFS